MPGKLAPPNHAALAALPVAVLDLETTGLDVRRDRVIQIGVVVMQGSRILDAPRLEQLIDPGEPIAEASTRIHGIVDADVVGAPAFADYVESLRELLAGRIVVGHHVAFDLAVLRHESARSGVPWHDPPSLDLALLVGALEPSLPDLGLETVASLFGVQIERRHSAMGDCLVAAESFARLVPRLRTAHVRTLGEARTFAARRSDLTLRQAQAGWDAVPGERSPSRASRPLPRIDSFVFERQVADVMSPAPAMIAAHAALRVAAREMVERRIGALLVGDPGASPQGIVTERDLLRVAARDNADVDRITVSEAMTTPVQTIPGDEMLYRALGRMDRLGIRHLCVVDADGVATGMLSQRDLLHHRARAAAVLDDGLTAAEDLASLAATFSTLPAVAGQLVADGLSGVDAARVISVEIRALTARAAELTLGRLREEGRGEPPAPWCVLVLGSGGRGESLLATDQDNALIHAGRPADDEWYAALGAGIAEFLDGAGVKRCAGGVMAANAEWRGSREQWRERVDGWLRRARPQDLLNVDIFFDLVAVCGEQRLAGELHEEAVRAACKTPPFLALLGQSVEALAPRFSLFGRLRSEAGRIDLKRDGLLPLVSLARTLALRIGSSARSTPERLRDAADAGRLSEGDAATLIETHAALLTLTLRQQLVDLENGVPPSSRVETRSLSRRERQRLRESLHRLDHTVRAATSMLGR